MRYFGGHDAQGCQPARARRFRLQPFERPDVLKDQQVIAALSPVATSERMKCTGVMIPPGP